MPGKLIRVIGKDEPKKGKPIAMGEQESVPDLQTSSVPSFLEALLPRTSEAEGAGRKAIGATIDVASLPFRGVAALIGQAASEAGHAIGGGKGSAFDDEEGGTWGAMKRAIARKGGEGLEGYEQFGEEMLRDPANVLFAAIPALKGAQMIPKVGKHVPKLSQITEWAAKHPRAARWGLPLGEGAVSTALHQGEHVAAGESPDIGEAAAEMGLSALFPVASEASNIARKVTGGIRDIAGQSFKGQLSAKGRKEVGDVPSIMDIATGYRDPVQEVRQAIQETVPAKKAAAKARGEAIEAKGPVGEAGAFVGFPPKKGDEPHFKIPVYGEGHLEAGMEMKSLDDLLDVMPPETGVQKFKRGLKNLKNKFFGGWTRGQTIDQLQEVTSELEGHKQKIFDIADGFAHRNPNRKIDLDKVWEEVGDEIEAETALIPIRKQVLNEFENSLDSFLQFPDFSGKVLPSKANNFKILTGKQGNWKKTYVPHETDDAGNIIREAEIKNIENPEATAKEVVYNKLYRKVRQAIEESLGGDVIKTINMVEHEIIPFQKGLQQTLQEQMGHQGRLAPILAGAAGGVAGPGAMLPAYLGSIYGRSQMFPRTLRGVEQLMDVIGPVQRPGRQLTRGALRAEQEAMRRRIEGE